jgi:hypothetical protein
MAAALPDNIRAQFASPWDAPPEPSDSDIGSLLFGIGMWFAGQSYVMAEAEWMNPNTCVEVKFEPDTRTQGFEPQRSYSVAASLQSKADNGLVPGRFDPVKERPQGQGSVTPTKAESSSETAARFVYRAGSTARANSGFRAEVKSRAGLAQAEWVLVNALSLSIEHRLWDDTSTATGQMGYALFSGTVKFDITLAPATNGMPHMLRGETTVRRDLQVGHGTGKCRGSGWEDEEWHVTAWLDPASRMIRLQLGFFAEVSKASWQCKGDVQRERELSVVLGTELRHLELSAVAGSTQQVSGRQRRANRNEELNVKVLSSPVEPAR